MKLFLIATIFIALNLEAKVIEVKQLFNKTFTKVQEENISISKSFYGKLELDESKTIDITNRFDGYITKLYANKTYMTIKKNEPLFSIYSDEILSVKREIEVSKNIDKNLYKSSKSKLEALGLSNENINKSNEIIIKSPANSIVIKKEINEGSFAKKGKLLLQLSNIDELWLIAEVYQKDLPFLSKGMDAKIYVDGFDVAIKSKVDFIYPIINEATKSVKVRFIVDNKDLKLYPNMFANVKISETKKSMKTLPVTAVLNRGKKFYVFKQISNNEIEPIAVEVNRISSKKYEIVEGLEVGEEVINNALFLLDSDAVTNALYDENDNDW